MVPTLSERAPIKCIALMGATATGKSSLALELAERLGGEIVSMDSRQVYRGMDIGTGKVPRDDRRRIAHHVIDVLDPDEKNSAGLHLSLAAKALREIEGRGKVALFVGGTGLYFRALFRGLVRVDAEESKLRQVRSKLERKSTEELYEELIRCDPRRARDLSRYDRARIARALEIYLTMGVPMSALLCSEHERIPLDPLKIVLTMPRFDLRARIAERTRGMFEAGWVEEVRSLLAMGYDSTCPGMNSLGYREIASALEKSENPMDALDGIITLTRQYAKRQETFFRSERGALRVDATEKGFTSRVLDEARKHLA